MNEIELHAPPYAAARLVAPRVQEHFVRHAQRAAERSLRTDSVPDAATIEAVVNAAFWASLRREEGFVPRISLAVVAPGEIRQPMRFEHALRLHPATLTRVAPAVERAGIHLGVCHDGDELVVWGTVRAIPSTCIVVEVSAPGLLVIKHQRGDEAGKFVNVAVLEGDQIKVVDERASTLPDCPTLVSSLLGFGAAVEDGHPLHVLVQLAVSMRAHGRGGSLLVVPPAATTWRDSIVQPMSYAVTPPYTELAALAREVPEDAARRAWQDAMSRAIDAVAGLTAVDGATLLTSEYDLLGFGAKIARRRGSPPVEQVTLTEPIEGTSALVVHPTQLGGTRHLSSAQFVHDQRDAVALVASQDGQFTVFAWSSCEEMVHAHRVEALLL